MKARDPQNPSIAHDTPGSENNKKVLKTQMKLTSPLNMFLFPGPIEGILHLVKGLIWVMSLSQSL